MSHVVDGHVTRKLRIAALRHANGSSGAWQDVIDAEIDMKHVAPGFAKVNAGYFLATAEGFLLTMDHVTHVAATTDSSGDSSRRRRARDAANILACMTPHTRTMGTQAPVNNPTAAAAFTTPSASASLSNVDIFNSEAGKVLVDIRNRLLALPSTVSLTEIQCTEIASIGDALTGFLSGATGSNPGRLGVSIFVMDKVMPRADASASLAAMVLSASAKLAVAKKLCRSATVKPDTTNAIEASSFALGEQCRVTDDRIGAIRVSWPPLHVWFHQGQQEAESMHFYESKEGPVFSDDILGVVCDGPRTALNQPFDLTKPTRRPQPAAPFAAIAKVRVNPGFDAPARESDGRPECVGSACRGEAADRLARMKTDVDFMGTSGTARDVDQLIAFGRATLEGGLPDDVYGRLLFDRQAQDDGRRQEPRALLPIKSTLSEAFNLNDDGDDDGAAQDDQSPVAVELVPLERIAMAIQFDTSTAED